MKSGSLALIDSNQQILTREEAISAFGVTYGHTGDYCDPISEILGTHTSDPDPVVGRILFNDEYQSVNYVRSLCRSSVGDAISKFDERFLSNKVLLNLNRFISFRKVGTFTSNKIISDEKARLKSFLRNGFNPTILRLPDKILVKNFFDLGKKVYVVDFTKFLTDGISYFESTLNLRRLIQNTSSDYDFIYQISDVPGVFRFDVFTKRFYGSNAFLKVFIKSDDVISYIKILQNSLSHAVADIVPANSVSCDVFYEFFLDEKTRLHKIDGTDSLFDRYHFLKNR